VKKHRQVPGYGGPLSDRRQAKKSVDLLIENKRIGIKAPNRVTLCPFFSGGPL
jgi:hypothetical protein